jgi:hypothetical protein
MGTPMNSTASHGFSTPIDDDGTWLSGPYRSPRQMLGDQEYQDHASIHDDATARSLGFKGGTIEGPTHFSQFAPLGYFLWGDRWLREGCLSVAYRAACYEGERVRALVQKPVDGATQVAIRMERDDGTEILRGTASVGSENPPSAVAAKLSTLPPPDPDRVILRDVEPGMVRERITVRMAADQHMGALYPFSLADKLVVITEPSPLYEGANGILPIEMVSVLINHVATGDPWTAHGPTVDLFTDQEIRMIDGPLLVGEPYEIVRRVLALSGSRRTESIWTETTVYRQGRTEVVASMILSTASLKESYANYAADAAALASRNQ